MLGQEEVVKEVLKLELVGGAPFTLSVGSCVPLYCLFSVLAIWLYCVDKAF